MNPAEAVGLVGAACLGLGTWLGFAWGRYSEERRQRRMRAEQRMEKIRVGGRTHLVDPKYRGDR